MKTRLVFAAVALAAAAACGAELTVEILRQNGHMTSEQAPLDIKDGRAVFRISGGKSTAAVRVYGFDSYAAPAVRFRADGRDTDMRLAGVNGRRYEDYHRRGVVRQHARRIPPQGGHRFLQAAH